VLGRIDENGAGFWGRELRLELCYDGKIVVFGKVCRDR